MPRLTEHWNYETGRATDSTPVTCNVCLEITTYSVGFSNLRDDYLCRPCAEVFQNCDSCGNGSPRHEMAEHDSGTFCVSCWENREECRDCDDVLVLSRHRFLAYGRSGVFCESCYNDIEDERHDESECDCGECRSEPENGLHSYSYSPVPLVHYGPNPTGTGYLATKDRTGQPSRVLYLGVELEIEAPGYDVRDRGINTLENAWPSYAKEDGSLMDYGFEQVSYPLTPSAWARNRDAIGAALAKLRQSGCRSFSARTCGLHVHMSRNAFDGDSHVYKFLSLFYHHPAFWTKLSGRGARELNQWATLSDCHISDLPRKANGDNRNDWPKYSAVNVCNSHTVEIRLFRGTLALAGFFRALQACESAYLYTRQASLTSSYDLEAYKRFVQDRAKQFPDFASWLVARSPHSD